MGLVRDLKLLEAVKKFQRDTKGADMAKLIPSFITLAITVAGLFQPEIQAALVAHPQASVVIAGIYALVKGLLPSPITASPAPQGLAKR